MAVHLCEERLRLVPAAAVADDEPLPSQPELVADEGGDDDCEDELDAPFPGESDDDSPDDFYHDAMDIA